MIRLVILSLAAPSSRNVNLVNGDHPLSRTGLALLKTRIWETVRRNLRRCVRNEKTPPFKDRSVQGLTDFSRARQNYFVVQFCWGSTPALLLFVTDPLVAEWQSLEFWFMLPPELLLRPPPDVPDDPDVPEPLAPLPVAPVPVEPAAPPVAPELVPPLVPELVPAEPEPPAPPPPLPPADCAKADVASPSDKTAANVVLISMRFPPLWPNAMCIR